MTSDGVNSYTSYDRANRLLQVTDGTNTTTHSYDGLGNRISQDVNGLLTRYLLDMQPGLTQVIAATTGGSTDRYVHTPRGIHAMKNNAGAWIWTTQDGLGNVRQELSDGLAVNGVRSYEPFLPPFDEQGSFGMPFGAMGEMVDVSGLVYLRNRYMSTALGQFISQDFLEGSNRYWYANGNPINWVDKNGLQTQPIGRTPGGDAAGYAPGVGGLGGGEDIIGSALDLLFGGIIGGIIVGINKLTSGLHPSATTGYDDSNISSGGQFGGGPSNLDLILRDFAENADSIKGKFDEQRKVAEICSTGLCGAGLKYLLNTFIGGNTQTQTNTDTQTKTRENEDDCDDNLDNTSAAIKYATIAREKYYLPASIGTATKDGNIYIAVAVTRMKDGSGKCREYVGISNADGKKWNAERRAVWATASSKIVAIAESYGAAPVFGSQGIVTYDPGVQGHAEMNLYNNLLIKPRAMGVTQAPCGLNQPDGGKIRLHARRVFVVVGRIQLSPIMM